VVMIGEVRKVKLSLGLSTVPWRHRGMELQLHASLTSAVDWGPAALLPGKEPPGTPWIGRWVSQNKSHDCHENVCNYDTLRWRWSGQDPPKRWYRTTSLHGITTQKTSTWNITAVKSKNSYS
jgi:hypothetical protein